MKKLLIFVLFFISAGTVYAEGGLTPGCTDPTASNYNANAQSDNGSCIGGQENANVQQIQANNAQRSTSQPSSGSGFVALAPIPGLTDTGALSAARSTNLASFFNNLYKFAIGMAAVLAVIQIIWGGIEIATNKDNVSKIIDSKGRILQAILGLVLVLSPVLVFSIINPAILNLSINLKPLDTRSVAPAQNVPAPARNTGRQVTGSSNVMNETITACSTRSCDGEIRNCMRNSNVRNASDYSIVCTYTDGSIAPNSPSGDVGCPISNQVLSLKCITFSSE